MFHHFHMKNIVIQHIYTSFHISDILRISPDGFSLITAIFHLSYELVFVAVIKLCLLCCFYINELCFSHLVISSAEY